MNRLPNNKPSGISQEVPASEKNAPTPGEFLRAIVEWLRHWHDSPREKSKAADWAMVALTVAVVIAAIWSACVFQGQLTEARKTTDNASDSFRIDERAWIELEPVKGTMFSPRTDKIGAAFRYELHIRNFGKTVARDIQLRGLRNGSQASISQGSNPDAAKFNDKLLLGQIPSAINIPIDNPMPKVLGPGATSPVPVIFNGQEPQYLTKDTWVSYLIGRIDYTDVFGIPHWVKFCFFVADARGNLWNCKEGNEEDRNPETPPAKPN